LGLAFGGAGASELGAELLQAAYRYVMFGATVLAVLSAVVAGLAISGNRRR